MAGAGYGRVFLAGAEVTSDVTLIRTGSFSAQGKAIEGNIIFPPRRRKTLPRVARILGLGGGIMVEVFVNMGQIRALKNRRLFLQRWVLAPV